jgi:hypothetical protein
MSASDLPAELSPDVSQPSPAQSLPLEVVIETSEAASKPSKTIQAALIHWKRRLLDLSKRNRLVNFKSTPVSTIAVVESSQRRCSEPFGCAMAP